MIVRSRLTLNIPGFTGSIIRKEFNLDGHYGLLSNNGTTTPWRKTFIMVYGGLCDLFESVLSLISHIIHFSLSCLGGNCI